MWLATVFIACLFSFVAAQSSNSSSSSSLSLSLTTSSVAVATTTRIGNQNSVITTIVPTVFNVTRSATPTSSSASSSISASQSATPSATPIVLATKLDPAFGVLGAILILTGLPSAFWGHKNRWTSFFLIGFYTLSLVCIVLILKFGVLPAVNPPSSTLRGMFVLASIVAGIAGGAISIFFWKAARYFIGGWGGFAFGLWPSSLRWILYIGCAAVGFVLCTIPKIHYHVLLVSTAFVGSSAFMLGVDCYTTAGLKEMYIWNLGFTSMFPKFTGNGIEFPVSQTMQIELGLLGAVALMGIAVQLRVLTALQKKLQEIAEEQKKRDEEVEIQAADRFAGVNREREQWEKDHPTFNKHGRQQSALSSVPLMKDHDGSPTPTTPGQRSSTFTLVNEGRPRYHSGVSDLIAAPTPDEELRRAARKYQNNGALPALDLGLGIEEDVPTSFILKDDGKRKEPTTTELEQLKRKDELMAEIQTIRRSIDALKSETPAPSSSAGSRRPSLTSRHTLSFDASTALLPGSAHLRPPRETDPRIRVRSMELSTLGQSPALGESISRPTSVPLRDEEWDTYVQERKLLQPPSGVTPPIPTTATLNPENRIQMPQAVTEALNMRKQRESALGIKGFGDSSEDIPLAKISRHQKASSGGNIPITILPPRKPSAPIAAPTPQRPSGNRTRTFEELNERHREKMRDLQAPLTQAEKEHADLEAARQRWERSKLLEKEAVTRRQAEKANLLEKKKRSARRSATLNSPPVRRHSRSPSADKLGVGSTSKRLSTLKVEDWQRYQQDLEANPSAPKRESRAHNPASTGVPFPDAGRTPENSGRRRRDKGPV
ncbi:hypothetical protein BD779DRAFT_1607517 [Infundibulicybe gibba]|nr:hypothetical protein BD779DRAFT_1607517 [Infundibulicybe gibba]